MQSPPPELAPGRISELTEAALLVDLRPPAAFAGGHVPGSVSLAPGGGSRGSDGAGDRGERAGRGHAVRERVNGVGHGDFGEAADFGARARTVGALPTTLASRDALDIYLLSASFPLAHRVAARLTEVMGLGVAGILPASSLAAWAAGGGRMRTIGRLTSAELADRRAVEPVQVVDAGEFETLLPRLAELDPDGTVVVAGSVAGQGVEAATTAASILLSLGHRGEVLILGPSGERGADPLPA